MKEYRFYGWETADIKDANGLTPRDHYDILSNIWCADTCAPRMRDKWSVHNPTLGQCSITAFLMHAQGADNLAYFKKCRAYETALELMAEGKFRHFGISFHDRADELGNYANKFATINERFVLLYILDYLSDQLGHNHILLQSQLNKKIKSLIDMLFQIIINGLQSAQSLHSVIDSFLIYLHLQDY